MPEIDTSTSAEGDQASTSGLPQVGTTTTDGQAPVSQTASTEHERMIAELRKENAAARKKLSAYEETERAAEAAKRAAEEATLSEIERVKKQHADLQAQHDAYTRQMQERVVRYEIESQARKLSIIDPDAAAKLLDWSELEFADDGTPANAEKLLEKLVKNKPYLVQAQQQASDNQNTQPPARNATPAIPAMNPGRTQIAQPGSLVPGQRPTIEQAYQMSRDRK